MITLNLLDYEEILASREVHVPHATDLPVIKFEDVALYLNRGLVVPTPSQFLEHNNRCSRLFDKPGLSYIPFLSVFFDLSDYSFDESRIVTTEQHLKHLYSGSINLCSLGCIFSYQSHQDRPTWEILFQMIHEVSFGIQDIADFLIEIEYDKPFEVLQTIKTRSGIKAILVEFLDCIDVYFNQMGYFPDTLGFKNFFAYQVDGIWQIKVSNSMCKTYWKKNRIQDLIDGKIRSGLSVNSSYIKQFLASSLWINLLCKITGREFIIDTLYFEKLFALL
jgi:hypothetical protein